MEKRKLLGVFDTREEAEAFMLEKCLEAGLKEIVIEEQASTGEVLSTITIPTSKQ